MILFPKIFKNHSLPFHSFVLVLTHGSCWFLVCALRRPFRVVDEFVVAVPEPEPGVEPAHECETEQQQGKHPIDHTCSYLNSQAYNYMHVMMIYGSKCHFMSGRHVLL